MIAQLFDISVGVLFGDGPSEMPLDDHLLLMIKIRFIRGVLEVLLESMA